MKKEFLLNIFKERKFVLFFSIFVLIFSILTFTFASAGDNTFKYYLIKFSVVFAILVGVLFLFILINKKYIRKIKNNKKLFLFGIIPFLIAVALILLIFIVSFLCVLKMSLDPLSYSIMNFFNWT
ncbi:hypothetical protein KAW80_04715, partial [Candidatus Babeliales bacterium]|nr:hypothetical protein [Candidatus Babeliales bacterium]